MDRIVEISDKEFDEIISSVMAELPQAYIKNLNNVVITYAEEPTTEQIRSLKLRPYTTLFGLFEGSPKTSTYSNPSGALPAKITLFKRPLLSVSDDYADLKQHIKRTLWHEIAHYYGLDHADIDRLQNGAASR